MSKLLILLNIFFVVTVHCGLLDNVLEDKKGLDNTVNSGIVALDKKSKPVVEKLTGLFGVKDDKSENDETNKDETKKEEIGKSDAVTTPKAPITEVTTTTKAAEPAKTDEKIETAPAKTP